MTKSRTIRRVGAVVLSLAMAVSTLAIAPSADAAAKKPALASKKGTITVKKSKTVKIKNVTKAKVKKLAVKSSNKKIAKVAKAGSGKKTAIKVTGVKAGKATITATVTLKKAVSKKKKFALKYKATVKAASTATATPGVLALDSVVSAVDVVAGGTTKYVKVTFNQKITSLDASQVEIYRVSDNQLFTVEKVTLAADGLSAQVVLLGDESQNSDVNFLKTNVEYKMVVTQNGKKAEKVFVIEATLGNATVVGFDSSNKTLSVRALTVGGGATITVKVPADITVNYEEAFGKAYTVTYDKNSTITKFTDLKENVVYGAFKFASADNSFTDLATGTKYLTQTASTINGGQLDTYGSARAASGKVTAASAGYGSITDGGFYAYAKLVLSDSGSIKFIEYDPAFTGFIKVGEVKNDTIINGTTQVSVKNFVIIKDGKSIANTDLVAGDVVAYDNTNSFAEVLPAANTTTGALTAVHDGSFEYAGKTYKISGTDANIEFSTKYSKASAAEGTADNTYLDSLFAAKKDVTVTLNRANQAVYLEGEQAAAATTSKTIVLTAPAKYYKQSLVEYIRVTGFDGEAVSTYDIDLSKVTKIQNSVGTWEVGQVFASSNGTDKGTDKIKAFGTAASTTNSDPDDIKIEARKDETTNIGGTNDTATVEDDIVENIVASELIVLTLDSKNAVTGIDLRNAVSGNGRWNENGGLTATGVVGTGAADTGKNFSISGDGTAASFKAGLTVAAGLQISPSTPIYLYDQSGSTPKVSVVTYDKFDKITDTAKANKVFVYTADNKKVSAVVVDTDAYGVDSDQDKKEGVIASISYSTAGKIDGFSILVGSEVIEATSFGDIAKAATPLAVGDIVTAGFKKGTKDLVAVATTTGVTEGLLTLKDSTQNTFTIDGAGEYILASEGTVTIAKPDGSTVVTTTIGDIIKLSDTNLVKFSTLENTGASVKPVPVDTIVISSTKAKEKALTELTRREGNLVATDIESASSYKTAVEALAADKVALDKYKASGATDAELSAHNTAYTTAQGKITAAESSLIVSLKKINDITKLSASGSGDTEVTEANIKANIPSKVTVVLAGGKEKEINVTVGTPGVSNTMATTSDWVMDKADYTANSAANTYTFKLVNQTGGKLKDGTHMLASDVTNNTVKIVIQA